MHGTEKILPVLVPNVTPTPGNSNQLMLESGHSLTINEALRQSVVNIHHAKDGATEKIAMEHAFMNMIVEEPVVPGGRRPLIPRCWCQWQQIVVSRVALAKNSFVKQAKQPNVAPEGRRCKVVIKKCNFLSHVHAIQEIPLC